MSYQDCVDAIKGKLGRELSDAEWEQTAEDVHFIIKNLEAAGQPREKIDQALAEAAQFARDLGKQAERNAFLNKWAFHRANQYVETVWRDNPAEGLRAMVYSSLLARTGAADSLAAHQSRMRNFYTQALTTELRAAGLLDLVKTGKLDEPIIRAAQAIDGVKDAPALADLPKEAVQAAQILKRHMESRRLAANASGANIGSAPGRAMEQTTDPNRIRGRRDEWVADAMEWLDWDRSLLVEVHHADSGTTSLRAMTPDERVKELHRLFTKFESGVHIDLNKGDPTGMKGMGNVAKSMSRERVMNFKPDHEFDYLRKYGMNSVFETTMHEIESFTRGTALMDRFGPNAKATLQQVYETAQKRLTAQNRAKDAIALEAEYRKITDKILPIYTGEANRVTPANNTGAMWGSGLRAVSRMASLGMSVISSLSDEAVAAAVERYTFGGGLTKAAVRSVHDMFGGADVNWNAPEVRELLADMAVQIDAERGNLMGPSWMDDNAGPGALDKAQQAFFRANGQRWWSDKNRAVHTLRAAARMGRAADKGFDALGPDLQRSLSRFHIDAPRWELMRQAAGKEIDGTLFLDPASVGRLSDEQVEAWAANTGGKTSPAAVMRAREEAADALRTFYASYAEAVITHPDFGTRAALAVREDKGTFKREFWDTATLFKTFPFAHVRQNLGREVYGRAHDPMGLAHILTHDKGAVANLASFMVASTVLGAASLEIKELLKGRTAVDPTEYPGTFALKAFSQGGGFGIYGDFFLGQVEGVYGTGPVTQALGPAIGNVNTAVGIYNGLIRGDMDQAGPAFKLLLNNVPGRNLPYTAAAFDTFAIWAASEYINPGYGRRVDRNLMERSGQTRWAAPMLQGVVPQP